MMPIIWFTPTSCCFLTLSCKYCAQNPQSMFSSATSTGTLPQSTYIRSSCCFLPPRSNYFPQHPTLNTCVFLRVNDNVSNLL